MLDVRPAEEFAAGHAKGALNVALGAGSFATKAGFVLPAGERVVIHASSAGQAEEAAAGLRSVGIFDLAGFRLCPPGDEQLASIELDELHRLVESDEVDVIDVREPHERDEGYIPGSRNIPYRLVARVGGRPPGRQARRDDLLQRRREPRSRRACSLPRAWTRGRCSTAVSRTGTARPSSSAAAVPSAAPTDRFRRAVAE